ncbi:MAG: tRNA (5-methylaminomethyl-2-thiouridine)(34)-methyltransferase MnmD [Flavobacteriaceae bacterium]|jgi:tRNA U34 5-methylaminomethyl-2-thiouridine-forming methyltransferase MnmC|nr:tRNA (5-methylaminomethyl-2-thiouridine)(34)-methyltransferase MnmD [Flavobacteriaceae bacterium]MCH1452798.1 tRNA (5-methylaminomethyl-2-thiouridine)(34)-methyltransferase MnmD [Flavobacteriaceae bacterium]
MPKKIITTGDGSPSIFIEELKETYHSKHGAVTESQYVYIKKGLMHWLKKNNKSDVKVFEMGLGTGLNAYLSYVYSFDHGLTCEYFSIEKYPLTPKELGVLKMKPTLPMPKHHHFFDLLHELEWNQIFNQSNFLFKKIKDDFLTLPTTQKYNVVFYDAFGYHAQSELWQEKALQTCFDILQPGGVWVSYCAKGEVRRTLQKIGFQVERLDGPPGKREMLRATKEV